MKITVYTITDCQFSKQELEYLKAHNLQYEEKNLELHREFLSEMLNISNNFAGTPVTKIEKDDGKITVIKGFTVEEFDEALGLKKEEGKKEDGKKEDAKPAQPEQPGQPQTPQQQPGTPAAPGAQTPAAAAPANTQPTVQPPVSGMPTGEPQQPAAAADPMAPKQESPDALASVSGAPVIPDLGPSLTTSQGISVDPSVPVTPPTIELPNLDAAPTAQAPAAPEPTASGTTDADLDAILKDLEMKASGAETTPPSAPAPATASPAQPVAAAPASPTTPQV